MKRPHLSLYGQILLWFFLNLALVAVVLILVLQVQFRIDPRSVIGGRTHEQFQAVASILAKELQSAPRSDWHEIMDRYAEAYNTSFAVYRPGGRDLLAGEDLVLPSDLLESFQQAFRPPPRRDRRENERGGPRGGEGPHRDRERPPGRERPPPPRPANDSRSLPPDDGRGPETRRDGGPLGGPPFVQVFYVGRSGEPRRYWAAALVSLGSREFRHPPEGLVVASSATLGGNEIFFDWRPWLWAIAAVLLVSALIWLPFVGRVSHRLRRLTEAAESISEGNFEVEVASPRTDELGRLSRAVQRMAGRLDDYVAGQKRFLGDIAHELCSPLARLRMTLGVLETRLTEDEQKHLQGLNEEAEALSRLVNELLDFSRASIAPGTLEMHEVSIPLLLREVAEREGEGGRIEVDAPNELWVTTNRDVLRRALANIVRNACRYAGSHGPVTLRARYTEGEGLSLEVEDSGPGISEEWIDRVFEPFSRPELARTREAGGAGLGLAIAKTCIEGLGGRVRARNRSEGGLSVELFVPSTIQHSLNAKLSRANGLGPAKSP